MEKACLHFTGQQTNYGFVADIQGQTLQIDSLIMPDGYIPNIIAPDGRMFKVVPGVLQKYLIPNIGEVIKIQTLICREGQMFGTNIDIRDEKVYMTIPTAQYYGCLK
ncbi:MAG: hypothetical protein LBM93_03770 [Oscillospiraceae bacterium]|nr:hypothetical protein [Oscillospiraceae bacterium]